MARIAFRLRIQPGKKAEYVQEHTRVWPELLADLKLAGYRNYSIFADGDELFGYFECDDPEAAAEFMAKSEVNARWQTFMLAYLEHESGAEAGTVTPMTEVFRLD